MDKRNAITVEEAQERLRQIKIDVRTEWMKAVDSLGRICAQDVSVSYTHLDVYKRQMLPISGQLKTRITGMRTTLILTS